MADIDIKHLQKLMDSAKPSREEIRKEEERLLKIAEEYAIKTLIPSLPGWMEDEARVGHNYVGINLPGYSSGQIDKVAEVLSVWCRNNGLLIGRKAVRVTTFYEIVICWPKPKSGWW